MKYYYLILLFAAVSCGTREYYNPVLFRMFENNTIGFMDSTGKVIISPKFHSAGDFSEGLAPVRLDGTYGYIDESGKFVIAPQFDYAMEFKGGYAIVYNNGHPFYIDHKGKKAFEHTFIDIFNFEKGRAFVQTFTGKWGIINPAGKLLIDTVYKDIEATEYGTYIVKGLNEAESGIIDMEGKFIIPYAKYNYIESYSNGFSKVTLNQKDSIGAAIVGFINSKGDLAFAKAISNNGWLDGDVSEGLAQINFDEKNVLGEYVHHTGFIDMKGNIVINNPKYRSVNDFNNGRAFVLDQDGKYWIINQKGEIVSNKYFDEVLTDKFHDNHAFVRREFKWGCIDRNGNYMIEPKFSRIEELNGNEDYFIFTADDSYPKYGIANMKGEILIPAKFEQVDPIGFQHGILKVVEEDRLGYVNTKGKYVWRQKKHMDEIDSLNIDYMNSGYYYGADPYREPLRVPFRYVSNGNTKPIPDSLHFKENKFEIIIDTTKKCKWEGQYEGITVYLINTTKQTFYFDVQDARLSMKMQALDKDGRWSDIEYLPGSWCGNSYGKAYLNGGRYIDFYAPVYHGAVRTKLRLELSYLRKPDQEENDILYSNVIDGSINPGQFWREPEYSGSNIMDPYK
ncbi:WG containing repeat-containing protein [Chitinophaga sp. CF118]|uniref:WG repeat-containing protein n=1 Tax=Chitinophaga sp. CF118 TaxID=1884367 RepID=UPI0008E2CC5B|nr:WG repeat-containing protein [Chitinophaga sp. CF118]SFD17177.1 WG containing repeat-containing protein [Chitinophaga sp. CF118]